MKYRILLLNEFFTLQICAVLLFIAFANSQTYHDATDCPTPPPSPCHCDKDMVDCRARNQTTVPRFLKRSNYLFKELRLGQNAISYIGDNAFENINVTAIYLDNNFISRIHPDAFTNVKLQLLKLDISHNYLTELPEAIGKLSNITSLDVSWNPINCENFTDGVLKSIGDFIHEFSFGDSTLQCWPSALHHLPQLHKLSFFGGQMQRLPHIAFHGFEWTLQKLWFKNTNLIAVPIALQDLKSIVELHFDDNIYVGDAGILIPAFAGMTSSLNTLSLENNNLTAFPSVLLTLEGIHNLSLARNNLQFISDQAVSRIGRNQLTTLNLQQSNLNRIPGALSKIISLVNLDLTNNSITTIEKNDLQKLTNLKSLNISYNPLEYISKSTFYDLRSLVELVLHDTMLFQVPEAVQNLPNLQQLDLSNDPATIECNCNLQWLWCYMNSYNKTGIKISGDCSTIVMSVNNYALQRIPMICQPCS